MKVQKFSRCTSWFSPFAVLATAGSVPWRGQPWSRAEMCDAATGTHGDSHTPSSPLMLGMGLAHHPVMPTLLNTVSQRLLPQHPDPLHICSCEGLAKSCLTAPRAQGDVILRLGGLCMTHSPPPQGTEEALTSDGCQGRTPNPPRSKGTTVNREVAQQSRPMRATQPHLPRTLPQKVGRVAVSGAQRTSPQGQ